MNRAKKNAALLLPALGRPRAVWRYFRDPETPRGPKLALLLAAAYVLLPADLIPDVAPMLGWLDDAGVVAMAVGYVARKFANAEQRRLSAEVAAG